MRSFETKKLSKEIIARRGRNVLRCTAVYLTATYLLDALVLKLYGYDVYAERLYQEMMRGNFTDLPVMAAPPVTAIVLAMLVNVMMFMLSIGFKSAMLKVSRGEEAPVKSLLDGFEITLKCIAVEFLTAAATVVGFVFLIVPGFILHYRYRLAILVLFDNPDKGVLWCMRESARLTKGHKFRLFSLHISFLPLMLLDAFVSMIMLPVVQFWLTPYMAVAESVFYNGVAGVPNMDISAENGREDGSGNSDGTDGEI